MRVLHLSRTMDQGGAEKVVFQLATECKARGMDVVVASSGGAYVDRLERRGIPHCFVYDLECKKLRVIFQTLRTLILLIKEQKIQILHTHHRMAAFYGWLLKLRFPRLRLVYTAHNVFYNRKFLTKITISAGEIVAVGANVKKNLQDVFDIRENDISIIYNAVYEENTDNFDESLLKSYNFNGQTVVGAIGRLSHQKGMDVFVRAIKQAREKNDNIKALIIGEGELHDEIQTLIHDLDLNNDIYMTGYQSRIVDWIRRLDFIVMPSRWEGFPLTPIEVFMAGKTLIASDIGGINEIVINDVNGYLVEKDNVNAFAKRIIDLAGDIQLRTRLEENGRECYRKHFDYHSFIERYVSIYETLTGEK